MDFFSQDDWQKYLHSDRSVSYPLIFIHGINGKTTDWARTAQTLSGGQYFQVRYTSHLPIDSNPLEIRFNNRVVEPADLQHFPKTASIWSVSYYTANKIREFWQGDLTLYAHRLAQIVDQIKAISQQPVVILIGHSMGGLVARRYMTLTNNRESVYRILTIGSPHEGVETNFAILGHFIDLRKNSEFFRQLEQAWSQNWEQNRQKWGVIGSVNPDSWLNFWADDANLTDSGGMGYVKLSSVIPFGEWSEALANPDKEYFHTKHFAYRLFSYEHHNRLLYCQPTLRGIYWALEKKSMTDEFLVK